MRLLENKKIILLIAVLGMFTKSHAQDTLASASGEAGIAVASASSDQLLYISLGVATILLVVIAGLGQILIRLSKYVYLDKGKVIKSLLVFACIAAIGSQATYAQTPAAASAAIATAPAAQSGYSLETITTACALLTEMFVIFMLLMRIWDLINVIQPQAVKAEGVKFELPKWFDGFNKSVAVEHERDILLDHDYYGIRELDNDLPPWWKYGFGLTIIWAFCYLFYFHVLHAGPLSAGEYDNEMAAAKIEKDAYMRTAKNNVDENTVVFTASYVADGQKIFSENCIACHGVKGQGGVGPNLTDEYWLHGGKINDVFKTIKYGYPAKGMKSWQSDLSAIQIAQVSSFVKSLKGTNPPNPKAPQGDMYTDSTGAAMPVKNASVQ